MLPFLKNRHSNPGSSHTTLLPTPKGGAPPPAALPGATRYGLKVRAKVLPRWSNGTSVPLPSRLLVRALVSQSSPAPLCNFCDTFP